MAPGQYEGLRQLAPCRSLECSLNILGTPVHPGIEARL